MGGECVEDECDERWMLWEEIVQDVIEGKTDVDIENLE